MNVIMEKEIGIKLIGDKLNRSINGIGMPEMA